MCWAYETDWGFVPTVSLPELTEVVLDVMLRTPGCWCWGDLNIHTKAALTGVAQDFMATMTTMELSQYVIGLTYEKGHKLDLVFSTELEDGDLDVEGLVVSPFSWSDNFLVKFSLLAASPLCKGGGSIKMLRPETNGSRWIPECSGGLSVGYGRCSC